MLSSPYYAENHVGIIDTGLYSYRLEVQPGACASGACTLGLRDERICLRETSEGDAEKGW